MTIDDVRGLLRKSCRAAGSQQAWAEKHKISPAYVSDVLVERRDPGPAILEALGLRAETVYVTIEGRRVPHV